MNSDWKEYQISDLCDLIVDCVNKTAPVVEYETPFKMIRTPNIRNGIVDTSTCRFVEKEVFDKWTRRASVNVGDVLLTREAPMGEIGMVKTNENLFLGQRVMQYRANPKVLNSTFLLYSFLSPFMQSQIFSHEGSGSVVSHIRVPDCLKFRIKIPPLAIQHQIAKILGDLDDKIALNTQINQTLEAMAQALFKSWFVNFDPVKAKMEARANGGDDHAVRRAAMTVISGKSTDELQLFEQKNPEAFAKLAETADLFPERLVESELGEIPEGWEVGKLSDLIEFNPKRTLKQGTVAPYLDMKNVPTSGHLADEVILREMSSGTKFINGDTLLARITPCLENGKTAFVDFLNENEVAWGSTEYIVMRPRNPIPASIGYLIARNELFRQFAIQSMTGTSGRQRADATTLANTPWVIYPNNLICCFGEIAENILSIAKSHGDENRSLSNLRDTLLPRLLFGEIDLDSLEPSK